MRGIKDSFATARAAGFGPEVVSVLLVCACAAAAVACSEDKAQRESLPDWSDGFEAAPYYVQADGGVGQDGGTPPEDFPENSFGIAVSADITYPIRIHKTNTRSQPCAVIQGSQEVDIDCVIEMDELDLYALGLKYDIVSPTGMCDFIYYSSYMFENFEVGVGPEEVSWTVDQNGNIVDEVNSVDGMPRCEFDYRWQYSSAAAAPNCCRGKYTRKVTVLKPARDGGYGDSADGGVAEPDRWVTVSEGNWNGNLAECYHGAAYLDKDVEFGGGWPVSWYIYIGRTNMVRTVEYHGLSAHFSSNVPLASFYDPADHEDDMPAAFKGMYARPYYDFLCLDDAEEIMAHVRVTLREWNEEAEFDVDGDPDTEGTEPHWGTPIHDIPDLAELTPGNQTFPEILPVVRPPGLTGF